MNEYTQAWQEMEDGKTYNRKIDYYNITNRNEKFTRGDQWSGVISNGIPLCVFNVFKRVCNYKRAAIMSQRVKMQFSPEGIETDTQDPQEQELHQKAELISKHSELKWEKLKMDTLIRDGLLDGFNSGDIAAYTYWDKDIDTKQTYGTEMQQQEPQYDEMGNEIQQEPIIKQVPIMGDFVTELIDGANVFFGNPNSNKVKGQPYIILTGRGLVEDLRDEARKKKVKEADVLRIVSDVDNVDQAGERSQIELDNKMDSSGKCLYLIKLRMDKKTKTVWLSKSTNYVEIQKEIDTGLRKYPLNWTNWETVKGCYHGQAEGTGLIANQILINKMYAMVCKWTMEMAFGKVAFDSSRIKSWATALGVAIPVDGPIDNAVQQLNPGQMNQVILTVLDKIVELTLEMLGATDTALGNVAPDNYKALVANQQQAAVPLENVKANLYQFVEDIGLTWLEFMLINYKVPRKLAYKEKNKVVTGEFDGSQYKDAGWNIKIDVGPSTYWSEMACVETLSNLYDKGKLTDQQYFERLPEGYIMDKQGIIEDLKKQAQQQAQIMEQQQQQKANTLTEQDYEQMAEYLEAQPPEIQMMVKSLPPEQQEAKVIQMMNAPANPNYGGGDM